MSYDFSAPELCLDVFHLSDHFFQVIASQVCIQLFNKLWRFCLLGRVMRLRRDVLVLSSARSRVKHRYRLLGHDDIVS